MKDIYSPPTTTSIELEKKGKLPLSVKIGLFIVILQLISVSKKIHSRIDHMDLLTTIIVSTCTILGIYTVISVLLRKNHGRWMLAITLFTTLAFVSYRSYLKLSNMNYENSAEFIGSIAGSMITLIPFTYMIWKISFGEATKNAFIHKRKVLDY